MVFCCESMEYYCGLAAGNAEDFRLSDAIMLYIDKFDEYGIPVHDGGESYIDIRYCPWCGKKLPDSRRRAWFEQLEKLGFDSPSEEEIPEKYRTDAWYRE